MKVIEELKGLLTLVSVEPGRRDAHVTCTAAEQTRHLLLLLVQWQHLLKALGVERDRPCDAGKVLEGKLVSLLAREDRHKPGMHHLRVSFA